MDADRCTGPMQPGSIGHAVEVKRILLEMELGLAVQNLELTEEARKMLYGGGLVYIAIQRPEGVSTTASTCESEGQKVCPECEKHKKKMREYMRKWRAKK